MLKWEDERQVSLTISRRENSESSTRFIQQMEKSDMNGPFLLAPTSTSIIVAWELESSAAARIRYGVNERLDYQLDVLCTRGSRWQDNLEGICLYRAVLKNLQPDSLYQYRVELATGESQEGSFTTLKATPDEIRLCVVSDSHAFDANGVVAAQVLRDKPDFMIHSGDIALGTGYQKDQYEALWFDRGKDFLKNIPVVYIDGNHDDGPYFEDYFMQVQKSIYHASPNGLHYSFSYGNVYFVFMNSNPWGLFEMNAVNSGLPVDVKIRQCVKESMEWLDQELKSDAARQAKWRIVVMHHPYTDHFTQKHVVNIVENNNVNVMISGHLHFYQKNVSIDPNVGARILYITQGSAQDLVGEMDFGTQDERILSEYPEVVAMGKSIYSTLDISDEQLVYRTYGVSEGHVPPQLLDETVLVQEKPQLRLADVAIWNDENDTAMLCFSGMMKNEGHGLVQAVVTIHDNDKDTLVNLFGKKGKERVVVIDAGETKIISGCIKLTTPGKHIVRIGDASKNVEIAEIAEMFYLSNMITRVGQGEDSNAVFVSVEVINPHKVKQTACVDLHINDKVVSSQTVDLNPLERKLIHFAHRFVRGGTYYVKIGELEIKEVYIEGTIKGTPLAKDLSGHGNDGIIRGTPRISGNEDGSISVALDNYGDYIEIPDNSSLHVQDGFTGMVWANMSRLANVEEKGHNPLMVKGPSTGWGVNYLIRMAVKRIGIATWGTCYDTTEYAWDGGAVPLGKWAQYTSTFNREAGGVSYINSQKVAEITGISKEAELRCWKGYPIFVGYSGIGHIIKELQRTKYFTHFPGEIGQIRFYSAKLSAEENQYIKEHPYEAGTKKEDMLVWLSFHDIETEGKHTTEWRRPAHFQPLYKAHKQYWKFNCLTSETKIPESASLAAIIEVSDDEETVKGSKTIVLLRGKQTWDISDLPPGQYIRIVSKFSSVVGPKGCDIPELDFYAIEAVFGNEKVTLKWGTRADWEKGLMEGAVGFEPLRRTEVIEEYTDVIH
ncbi:MAG: metallophosphoesterase [Firmicutes bacterium]|nr:metallophosphoesterase [Bacillota bacterium]